MSKAEVLAEPFLVGRQHELEELQRYLNRAIEGKGNTVFVSGDAGSGKSRLVKEFLNIAKNKNPLVLSSGCLSDVTVPYFPFMEALGVYFSANKDEKQESEIRTWLMGPKKSATTGRSDSLTPQAWKDLTFVAVTNALLSIASRKPTILFIEDVHWADSASLSLLHYISRAISSARVLVLATFRSEELTADAEGHPHPLVEALRLMGREDLFSEINLSGLNQEFVGEIAKDMVGGSLDPALLQKLTLESRGNALFVIESLRMLAERGNLVRKDDRWCLAVDEFDVPSKFRDIILRRLGVLKLSQRRVLDMASVIGEKFSPELIGFVLDQETLDVLETLNAVAQSTSLVRVEGDLYKFDHAKIQKILYEEIPSPLKKGYHARVAQRLESKGKIRKELPLSDLAYHYAQAGNKEKAVEYTLEAGEDALARFGNVEAIKHFTYVLQMIAEEPSQAEKKTRALQGLGEAFFANSMFKEALKAFERIYSTETGIARLRAFRWALDSAFFQGDSLRLAKLAKEAENYAAVDRLEWARVRMNRGRSYLLAGYAQVNAKAGLEDFQEALRVDEEEYSIPDTARTLVGLGVAYFRNGEQESAIVAELRAIALYEELNDLRGQMDACNRAGQYSFVGLEPEAVGMFSKAIKIGEKIGDYNRVAEVRNSLSELHEISGDLGEALSQSLRALEYCQKTDSGWTIGIAYASLVRQYTRLGDMARAEECYEKFSKLDVEGSYIPLRELTPAVLFAGRNQWKESAQCFSEITKANLPAHLGLVRVSYAWSLERQGLMEEARLERKNGQIMNAEIQKKFEHFNLRAHLMVQAKVGIGQAFNARLDIVNVSRSSGFLVRVENLPLPEFRVAVSNQEWIRHDDHIDLKETVLAPFSLATVKFNLQATKTGVFTIDPQLTYRDDRGETKTCHPSPISINVSPTICGKIDGKDVSMPILPGRISTGFAELDVLLLGGIPEIYSVALTASPSDEREKLVKSFLEAGVVAGEPTFYMTGDVGGLVTLAEKAKSNFYVFICNPRAVIITPGCANFFKLKGVENLTEIDIALTKAIRTLNTNYVGAKRACIEITSDVLLQHHALITRKWLTGLLADLKAKGFTTLAVIDPQMHPKEEVQAILGLFEGELRIAERECPRGLEKTLRVAKLSHQKHLDQVLCLTNKKSVESDL